VSGTGETPIGPNSGEWGHSPSSDEVPSDVDAESSQTVGWSEGDWVSARGGNDPNRQDVGDYVSSYEYVAEYGDEVSAEESTNWDDADWAMAEAETPVAEAPPIELAVGAETPAVESANRDDADWAKAEAETPVAEPAAEPPSIDTPAVEPSSVELPPVETSAGELPPAEVPAELPPVETSAAEPVPVELAAETPSVDTPAVDQTATFEKPVEVEPSAADSASPPPGGDLEFRAEAKEITESAIEHKSPQGFSDMPAFSEFGDNLRQGLTDAGYSDVAPILQSSAVTVIAHPISARVSADDLAASTKRSTARTEARFAFAVLTTERKAA
jgi:hypothetical protein